MKVNLFNSKKPNGKRVPVTIVIEQPDIVNTNDGEILYLLSFSTGIKGLNGKQVDTVYINNVTETSILEEINKGLIEIGSKIDWGILDVDDTAPIITNITPKNNEKGVPIDSYINLTLKDPFPTSFIDLDTIKLKVNGIDVTNKLQIKQKGIDVYLTWIPIKII